MKHLFVDNPMLAELERHKRTALAKRNWSGPHLVARILLIAVYGYLFYLTVTNPRSVEPVALLYIMLVLMFIVMPATLHGVVAGEREKRSLDLLLVAPVTVGQIIVGKYFKGLTVMFGIVAAIGVPCFIVQLRYGTDGVSFLWADTYGVPGFLRGVLLVVSVGAFLGALSIWVSSRTKSNASALVGIVGAVFVLYILSVVFAFVLMGLFPSPDDSLINLHPYVALANTYVVTSGVQSNSGIAESWVCIAFHSIMSVLLLNFARENLDRISKGRI